EFYKVFRSINNNDKYLTGISSIYNNLKIGSYANLLIETSLLNTDGTKTKLQNINDYYIYLDFWSSSCNPCIEEFKDFNFLANEFKNDRIKFVGINVWDDQKKWSKTIKKYNLKGDQYYSNDSFNFLDSLGINGIPRYMLLSGSGNIIEYNALWPSNPNLKKQLESLLKKK